MQFDKFRYSQVQMCFFSSASIVLQLACGSSAAAAATASAVGAAAVISRAVGTSPLNPVRAPTTFSPCEHSVSFTNTFLAVMLSRSNHVGSRNRYNVSGYISVLYDYPVIGVTRSSC